MASRDARDDANRDDEMDLINAEFESMVADLNLDQSSPRTFLDELEEIDESERTHLYIPPKKSRGLHGSVKYIIESVQRWWKKPPRDDSDGAIV
ncbi:hypothetical protein MCEMRE196_00861 [Candidatus Nanopelagicaceae bacterium]